MIDTAYFMSVGTQGGFKNKKLFLYVHLSNEKHRCCLGYSGEYTTHRFWEYKYTNYKDPY